MRETKPGLEWQSKAILLIVVPWTAISVLLQSLWWAREAPVVVWTTLGISATFGLIVWRMRAGTLAAAATGAAITASLMYSTTRFPYERSWLHGGLLPLLAVFLLTFAATKIGKAKKERLGTGESKRGRNAAQVAANLGVAAPVTFLPLPYLINHSYSLHTLWFMGPFMAVVALSEAAADTVSSEIGQVLGGKPRMITTLRMVEPGTDGGVTVAGTLAGFVAAFLVATVFLLCSLGGVRCGFAGCNLTQAQVIEQLLTLLTIVAGGTFGLLFDSLLGATVERKGWLNNDAVNFLSTVIACLFAMTAVIGYSYWTVFGRH